MYFICYLFKQCHILYFPVSLNLLQAHCNNNNKKKKRKKKNKKTPHKAASTDKQIQ